MECSFCTFSIPVDGLRFLQHVFNGWCGSWNEPHEHDIWRSGSEQIRIHALLPRLAPQEENTLHTGANLRTGTALQAAEVPVSPGERASGQYDRTHTNTGEDLVPEPSIQDEKESEGQGQNGPQIFTAVTKASRRTRAGEGRQTMRGVHRINN